MSYTSFLPEIKLPRVEVDPIELNPYHPCFHKEISYVPGLSNIQGAFDILIGTAALVGTVATAILSLVLSPVIIASDIQNRRLFTTSSGAYFFSFLVVGYAYLATTYLARGIIESIPVLGNLTLAFWDGKIRIIPT